MSSNVAFPPRKLSGTKNEKPTFSSSDDHGLIKQIESTHAPDDCDLDVKPLLQIVEDVFHRATPVIPGVVLTAKAQLDETALDSDMDELLQILSRTIYKISCELTCRCTTGGDLHSSSMAILVQLSNYKWDTKLVVSVAAFAVIYGEFWLDMQLYNSNYLAKGVALLKQLPSVPEQRDALKPKLETMTKLIQSMLDVSKCIVRFKELPSQHISHETQELASAIAYTPTAVYWSVRAAIACASQIVGLIGWGHEYMASTQESWELLSLVHKLNGIHEHLTTQLVACHKHIAQRKYIEAYQSLVRVFSITHIDNCKILYALFPNEEALFDGYAKKMVNVTVLRKRLVLLLISDLDMSLDELLILSQMYEEARQQAPRAESQYEVVWLPIVAAADHPAQWTDEMERRFKELQEKMPWYSVHPCTVDAAVVKYVKEDWGFNKRPMLVVLDQQGAVMNENAMHMMWIWGSVAYPFTTAHETALWRDASWRIDLLADSVEPAILDWMNTDKYICLYGGEDMDWIRKITTTANTAATAAGVSLEMLYVGKSNPRDRIRKNIAAVRAENLSHSLQDLKVVWFFWARLESMWHSKTKHKKSTETEDDPIMHEITTMLTLDGSEEGWALVSFRATEMAKAKGETMVRCFKDYKAWIELVSERGFVGAVNDYLRQIHTPHHCNRLILPGTETGIPQRVVCAECGKTMEKFIMYRCCND